jgi:hypothetical protein
MAVSELLCSAYHHLECPGRVTKLSAGIGFGGVLHLKYFGLTKG